MPITCSTLNISSGTKYILHWNEAYGSRKYGFDNGNVRFIQNKCKVRDCVTTDNRKLLGDINQFDAIIFHQRSMSQGDMPNQKQRRPEQRYIHWMMEAPSNLYGWNP